MFYILIFEVVFTTSIKLVKSAGRKLLEQVVCDRYGMNGKSEWPVGTIESFLQLENFPELVEIAAGMEHLAAFVNSICILEDLMKKIDKAVIAIREKYPPLKGVQSNIIRASILQRLIIAK